DGDGAALMRLGAMATIGYERPPNLIHILLDNEMHESTGGQSTVSHSVDLGAVARGCGYPRVIRAGSLDQLAEALRPSAQRLPFTNVLRWTGVVDSRAIQPDTPGHLWWLCRAWSGKVKR